MSAGRAVSKLPRATWLDPNQPPSRQTSCGQETSSETWPGALDAVSQQQTCKRSPRPLGPETACPRLGCETQVASQPKPRKSPAALQSNIKKALMGGQGQTEQRCVKPNQLQGELLAQVPHVNVLGPSGSRSIHQVLGSGPPCRAVSGEVHGDERAAVRTSRGGL